MTAKEILQEELEAAAHRMQLMAKTVEESGLTASAKLYRQWAEQARYALREAEEARS